MSGFQGAAQVFQDSLKGQGVLVLAAVGLPWQAVRAGVEVKLLPQDEELYVLAQSHARIHKERAMRRRKLKWLSPARNCS